jgi:hypothetical protein
VPALLAWQHIFGNRQKRLTILLPNKPNKPNKPNNQSTAGRLPPNHVQGVVRKHFGEIRSCYERGLMKKPDLLGIVSVQFVIGSDGKVTSAEDYGSNILDLEVRECAFRIFRSLAFDPPQSGSVVVVYPIVLMPDPH